MHAAGRHNRAALAQRLAQQPNLAQLRAERLRTAADAFAAGARLPLRVAEDDTAEALARCR